VLACSSITVNSANWTPTPPIPGSVSGPTQVVEDTEATYNFSGSGDNDTRSCGGNPQIFADNVGNVSWSATAGQIVASNGNSVTWKAPKITGGKSQSAAVIARIDDIPIALGSGETGSRDDSAGVFPLGVTIVPKQLSNKWDSAPRIRGLLPQDRAISGPATLLKGQPGGYTLSVLDEDTLKDSFGNPIKTDQDGLEFPVWSAVGNGGGTFSNQSSTQVSWKSDKTGKFRLKVTIDDAPKPLGSGETGSRDDKGSYTDVIDVTVK